MRNLLFILLSLWYATSFANVQDTYQFTSTADTERFQTLTQEIRCVVCQNQNIADSNAPLAKDLRQKVYQMIIENKSNEDIKNYLLKRYGDFILLQPRFTNLTWVLWLFPFLAMSFFAGLFVVVKRKL